MLMSQRLSKVGAGPVHCFLLFVSIDFHMFIDFNMQLASYFCFGEKRYIGESEKQQDRKNIPSVRSLISSYGGGSGVVCSILDTFSLVWQWQFFCEGHNLSIS